MQERLPGDAGLADDAILGSNRQNLFFTTRISGLSPFEGSRLPRTAMAQIDRLVAKGRKGGDAHAAAMATMGHSARSMGAGFSPVAGRMASIPRRLQAGVPRDAKALGHYLTVEKKASGLDVRDQWRLYRSKDRSGRETVFARPQRLRDPAGGWHEVTRADGTKARFPNMLGISRFEGKSGPRLGPRRLFTPVGRAKYAPILQAPWDDAAAMAHEGFPALMRVEIERRLVRRAERRRY